MELEACSVAPENWQRIAIKNVCQKVTSGGTPSRKKPEYFINGSIGWVKTKELEDGFISNTEEMITPDAVAASSAKLLPQNTILLAMYGATVGMLGILSKEMACNQACCAMLVKPEFDRDFLFYQLLAHRIQLQSLATGAAQQNLSGQQIKELIAPFPPIQEQKAIGSYLRLLDDRINLLRETNKTLEAIAQALFKSWFVDFDPVRAKMEGRQPEGMDEATAALFPDSFEESELGKIPLGWLAGKLSNVATLKGGKMLDKSSFSEAGANPVFGGAGVMGYTDLSNADGFVITVGRVGAYCGQYFWHQGNAWVNNNASLVSPINPSHAQWLYLWLKNADMELIKKGAAQPFVSNGDISELKIALPPADVIEKFTEYGTLIFEKIAQTSIQTKSLINLRDTLLPRLISGHLRLPDAEAEIEAHTA